MPPLDELIAELSELIAIPSVSADPAHQSDVAAAAEWVAERVRRAGGTAEVIPWGERPLVVGEVRASQNADSAPTILCYGHFDVQPPDPLELWESPPFELVDRDGWLYARGTADDKGQLFMLLKAAELLAAAGELPVNLRFACDGEEEIGGHSIVDWIAADERGADAAIVFDSGMVERDVPGFNIAVRGLCYFHVTVRTGSRDLHSGMYGGASLNAMHALMQTLSAVLPRDGRLPEELRVGVVPPSDVEVAAWQALPAGPAEIAAAGSRPADEAAGDEFYLRTWARALRRRSRHPGRLPGAPEDRHRRRSRGERLDPARRRPGSCRHRAGVRSAPSQRCTRRARTSRSSCCHPPRPASFRRTHAPLFSASTPSRRCSASVPC